LIRAAPIQSRDILAAIDGVAAQTDARADWGFLFTRAACGREWETARIRVRIYEAQ